VQILRETLGRAELGAEMSFENLTMFPLLDPAAGEANYATLQEGVASGAVRITEVSDGGSVPELAVVNDGDRPVLLLDGEELVGAKQNRIVNLTILVPARPSSGSRSPASRPAAGTTCPTSSRPRRRRCSRRDAPASRWIL
jgi:hypothetical protein